MNRGTTTTQSTLERTVQAFKAGSLVSNLDTSGPYWQLVDRGNRPDFIAQGDVANFVHASLGNSALYQLKPTELPPRRSSKIDRHHLGVSGLRLGKVEGIWQRNPNEVGFKAQYNRDNAIINSLSVSALWRLGNITEPLTGRLNYACIVAQEFTIQIPHNMQHTVTHRLHAGTIEERWNDQTNMWIETFRSPRDSTNVLPSFTREAVFSNESLSPIFDVTAWAIQQPSSQPVTL